MRLEDISTLRKRSTRDFAYIQLKQRIISGELKPDAPIVEDQIAKQLSISRTPLREALQRLEMEELIIRQHNGRLKVSPISTTEVREIFTVRKKLEEIVIVEAIEKATDADYNQLANIILLLRETVKQNNIDDALYYGSQFHQYIYELSHHKLASNLLSQLNDRIYRYRWLMPMKQFTQFKQSIGEHELILSYMKAKDKTGAIKLIQDHLNNSLQAIVQVIENETTDGGINK